MNRIRNTRSIRSLAIASLITLGLVACGGSDAPATESTASAEAASSDTISAEAIAPFGEGEVAELRALMASFGAPVDETKCMAETLAGNVDKVELKKMLDAAETGDVNAEIDTDTAVAFNDAITTCGLS